LVKAWLAVVWKCSHTAIGVRQVQTHEPASLLALTALLPEKSQVYNGSPLPTITKQAMTYEIRGCGTTLLVLLGVCDCGIFIA